MSEKVCPSCKGLNNENATRCAECGAPLDQTAVIAPPPNPTYAPPPPIPSPEPPAQGQAPGYQGQGYQAPAYQAPSPQAYQPPAYQPPAHQGQGYQAGQNQSFAGMDPDDARGVQAAQAAGLVIPPGFAPAGFGVRFVAFLLDGLIQGIAAMIAFFIPTAMGLPFLGFLAYMVVAFGYFIYFWGSSGQSPGKKIMGLHVVSTDGQPMSYGKATLRLLGYMVSGMILYIGFLMIAFDDAKRGLHDRIATTLVVKEVR
ncbi:MAG: RDD family protein [Bacillota bacterium]